MTLPGDDQQPDSKGVDHPPRATGTAREQRHDDEPSRPREIGGRKGPEPTRFGDWEYNGRCTDFE